MASDKVVLKRSAGRELENAGGKKDRQRIVGRIAHLAEDPRPAGVERLSGTAEKYRVRQGDYRMACEIDDATATVTVVKIGHRRDVYRRM